VQIKLDYTSVRNARNVKVTQLSEEKPERTLTGGYT